MKKSRTIIRRHNLFCGAIWASVHLAAKTQKRHFAVVQEPGQRRWLVTDVQFVQGTRYKSAFEINSFQSRKDRQRACLKAKKAIERWREGVYRKLTATGNPKWIPRRSGDNTQEVLLQMAACRNNIPVMVLLIRAGADINFEAGKAMRVAVHRNQDEAVIALIRFGASVTSTKAMLHFPHLYGTPRSWLKFLARLIGVMMDAGLDETLPVFDELAKIAQEPQLRPAVEHLSTRYPSLSAKLL